MRFIETLTIEVRIDDLTTSELMAFAVLLIPAHTRVLAERGPSDELVRPGTRRKLNVVRSRTEQAQAPGAPV
jgi:hypothetical protein